MKVLLTGIDTLEVGYGISEFYLSDAELEMLATAKLQAGYRNEFNSRSDEIVTFRGKQFVIKPSGTGRHNYILINSDITMKLRPQASNGCAYPEVQIAFRSECLWRRSWEYATECIGEWVRSWAKVDHEKIARADLCVDIAAPIPELTRGFEEVMCRSAYRQEYTEKVAEISRHVVGHHCTGYTFGKGGNISINIYDKSHEVKRSHKEWFYNLWANSCPLLGNLNVDKWQDNIAVTRVEARLRRDFLRSMQINTIADLKKGQADLWQYLTDNWLSIRQPSTDMNHSRWSISAFWSIVQSAVLFFGKICGVTRIKQIRPHYQKLKALARGVLVSMGAHAAASFSNSLKESVNSAYGKRVVRLEIENLFNSQFFEEDIGRRAIIFGAKMF